MDRRERYYDPEEVMRMSLDGKQAQMWTALPGIIQSFNPAAMTCEVQPTISGDVRGMDGNFSILQMPLLLDCPVFFPGGGGATLTFPIKPGDECLVVFASRCIDSWWQLGGVQGQAELRMHDLSDGFVFAGVRSQPRAFDASTSATQLRSDDGQAFIELNPATHNIRAQTSANISASAGGSITAGAGGNITANAGGDLIATAAGKAGITAPRIDLNGEVYINGINFNTHTHSGVEEGGGNSGGPQ